ncbi:hypothetical protein BBK36DRAFT_1142155 [Trichoderma citrinoviride]|uniref:Uncharacterized protein n=1 Tax=Trichoderma citrinoviride TaxID=58853 RepID=A0A2T4B769_9HYPO|nr:hypothetical protein BBK36DRAFT_1142155 [Trichoderma citrinoviride]PTB65150.1 hypothetical protein BBK36DRAFT_1142155 [Trichoderma citrinoviride]
MRLQRIPSCQLAAPALCCAARGTGKIRSRRDVDEYRPRTCSGQMSLCMYLFAGLCPPAMQHPHKYQCKREYLETCRGPPFWYPGNDPGCRAAVFGGRLYGVREARFYTSK